MRQLTAFEHGWLGIGHNGEISEREAHSLATAQQKLPKGCLEWGYQRVKFTQYCGVVQIDGLQIEVLPKLYPNQTVTQQRDSLLTMLAYAGDLQALDSQSASLKTSKTTLLDLFIRHFARLLEQQLQQGLLRDYQDIDDTLGQVRGRIDVMRQQRENLFKPHYLACRFNELIADIPVNRLLHTALILVTRLCASPELYRHLNALRHRFTDIATLKANETAPAADELNRLQQRYAPVVELAHLFLNGQFLDARSGQHEVFSLLFDMNRLFERYAASRLRPAARAKGLRLVEQKPRKYLAEDDNNRSRVLMRPDIALMGENNAPVMIMDAKWKHLEGKDPLAALSASDLYQVAAYADSYSCPSVYLLYPEQPGLTVNQPRTLQLKTRSRTVVSLQPVTLDGKTLELPLL